jgi:hypothetical protein
LAASVTRTPFCQLTNLYGPLPSGSTLNFSFPTFWMYARGTMLSFTSWASSAGYGVEVVSRTRSVPTASALTMLLNCDSCGLLNAGSMMRCTLHTTSSTVSGVPSWNLTSVRMSRTSVVSFS